MNVLQDWVVELKMMQQTVLLTAIRGPDSTPKYSAIKMLLRWYRRCVLKCALNGEVLRDPVDQRGGSFTGPSLEDPGEGCNVIDDDWDEQMQFIISDYLREIDAIPHHFQLHFMHASEILGYKHPDRQIRDFWFTVYMRLVNDMHVHPESEKEMDARLGDSEEGWLARADPATVK